MDDDELRRRHPNFIGNPEHLRRLMDVLDAPRKSEERRTKLDAWAQFNTMRSDSVTIRRSGKIRKLKGRLRITYVQADLRGASFDRCFMGSIDLSGAKLDGATFRGATLTHARLRGASLEGAVLEGACLKDADLTGAVLLKAHLEHAYMPRANLSEADCRGAHFDDANLEHVRMSDTDLRGADLSRCSVFGLIPWNVSIDAETRQNGLTIVGRQPTGTQLDAGGETRRIKEQQSAKVLTVRANHLQGVPFLYSMFQPDLRAMLGDVISQAVLLLGRFDDSGEVLKCLAEELRQRDRLPLVFTFANPDERTLKETVLTLAGLCKFVIADLTDAQSVTYELATIVGQYKIPVVPLVRSGRGAFSMFSSLDAEYRDRLLPLLEYDDVEELIARLDTDVIDPAERLSESITLEKVHPRPPRLIRKIVPDL